jgi:dipeptide/tripeptide permease
MVTIGDIGSGYSFALSPDVAGEYEWIWSIFFNTCYVCMTAGGIWYYLVSGRNNIQDNPPNKTLNTSTL